MRVFVAGLVLALLPATARAAPPPPAGIMKLAEAIVHTTETGDSSGLANIYTADATVVDEIAPFVWRGARAGTAWWGAVEQVIRKEQLTHFKVTNVRISEFVQTPTDAYMIQTMTIAGNTGNKPFSEPGTWTYSFHKTAGRWLISAMIWTTKP